MRSVLWQQQFGSTRDFAIRFGLTEDPVQPAPRNLRDASWGTFEIWVGARCITAAHHGPIGETEAVEWYLLELLRWGVAQWGPLLHESRFPQVLERVATAADWASASLEPPISLLDAEERTWYAERLSWWRRHALRAAADGGCFPNVLFRRLGNEVEVSWDNLAFPPCHPEVTFKAERGREILPIELVAEPLAQSLLALAASIRIRCDDDASRGLVDRARALSLSAGEARKLLLTDAVAQVVPAETPPSDDADRRWHSFDVATLLFSSSAPRIDARDVREVLSAIRSPAAGAWKPPLAPRQSQVPTQDPYRHGYELAIELRDELGWGGAAQPNLVNLVQALGVQLRRVRLQNPALHGFSVSAPGCAPLIGINETSPRAGRAWSENMVVAHELCHLLFDGGHDGVVSVLSGSWTEWPMEARANAFAAMLLMPDEGVRKFVAGRTLTKRLVREFGTTFGVGLLAATWHLKNRGFITDAQRLALLVAFGSSKEVAFGVLDPDLLSA